LRVREYIDDAKRMGRHADVEYRIAV
jgi:hypothetical protein